MGTPKESLPFGANTMLGRTAEVLLECADPVCVVARDREQRLPPLPARVLSAVDERPDTGPLAAIATGMRTLLASGQLTMQDAAFVTGCDAPFVTAAVVQLLAQELGEAMCAAPFVDDVAHPLCAVWRLSCLPVIDEALQKGIDAPRTLLRRITTHAVQEAVLRTADPRLLCLLPCNSPADYDAALRAHGETDGR